MKRLVSLLVFWVVWVSAAQVAAQESCDGLCALVIGNAEYDTGYGLANPVRDAEVIASKLQAGTQSADEDGFDVTLVRNASLERLRESLNLFSKSLDPDSVVLFFYAGHAVQVDGLNYLLPVDTPFPKAKTLIRKGTRDSLRSWLETVALPLDEVMATLSRSDASLRILLLDACRDDPLGGSTRSLSRAVGLAKQQAMPGTIISYATQPGNIALDGNGVNSPYSSALSQRLWTPGVTIGEMLNLVGNDVLEATDGFQQPWVSSSPIPIICLASCGLATREAALSQLSRSVAGAIRARDITGLQLMVPLSAEQRTQWQALFNQYVEFRITIDSAVVDTDRDQASVSLRIKSVQTTEGQQVIPADAWGALTLESSWHGQTWRASKLSSEYLENDSESFDYIAPQLSTKLPEIRHSGTDLIEVETLLNDESGIEAASLYYRDATIGGDYRTVPLEQIGKPRRYRSTLYTRHLESEEIDVYIEAIDINGNRSRYPPSTQPQRLALDQADIETSPAFMQRRWLWAAGTALMIGILLASEDDGNGPGDTRPVHITTPLR